MLKRLIIATSLILVLCSIPLGSLAAQEQTTGEEASAKEAGAASRSTVPGEEELVALICSTLIALNQANATGNYSVFREMGAPGFQIVNSTRQLSETFAELRGRNFDLLPIVVLQPKLMRPAEINSNGMLRVTGFFPTQPEKLNFDLIFQSVTGQWRLFGIAANTTPVEASGPNPEAPQAPHATTANILAATNTPPPKPVVSSTSAGKKGSDSMDKPELPDVRNEIEQLETATDVSASTSKSTDEESSYNPFAWLR